MRPYATAGVALVGASVIAVGPIAPTRPQAAVRDIDVTLTAGSIANVPANAFLAVLNTPANLVYGIQRFADSMAASGSWNESHPNNVWGWDPANPRMLKGFVDMLLPFPALSRPLGEHLNWWAAANLPMHEGCAYQCPDLIGMLQSMFRVPMREFYDDGFTFAEVINPVDGMPTEWSCQTVRLDPLQTFRSVSDYFFGEPHEFHPVTLYDFVTAGANLAAALQITGHVPTSLAVRQIETLVKLFLPKPENPAVEPVDYHCGPPSTPRTLAPDAVSAHLSTVEEARNSPAGQPSSPPTVIDGANQRAEPGAGGLTTLVRATDAAVTDVVATATEPVSAESADEESATETEAGKGSEKSLNPSIARVPSASGTQWNRSKRSSPRPLTKDPRARARKPTRPTRRTAAGRPMQKGRPPAPAEATAKATSSRVPQRRSGPNQARLPYRSR